MLIIESAKLTGTPGGSGWAQVHDFEPEETEKKQARGHLFAVIATSRIEEGVETVSAGRELLSRLHEEYFGDLSAKPFNALKNAVEKVAEEFKQNWGDVEIVASSVVNGVVYSAAGGGGRVIICREGATGTILASEKGMIVASSGFPKAGDVVLMATKPFFDNISQGAIRAALTSENSENAIETFAPAVRAATDLGCLGVVVIKFSEKTFPEALSAPETAPAEENTIPVKKKISEIIAGIIKKIPQRSVYLKSALTDEATSQSRKVTFSIAIILILILVVSVGLGIRQKKLNDLKGRYKGFLTEAQNDVDQAISLASINPERSRELFVDSEQKLNQILTLKVKDTKVNDLKKKIDDSRAAILGEYLVSPSLFLDLTLLSSGFKGDTVSVSGGSIYILDKTGRKIVSVAIDTKKSKVVAGPILINEALDLASYEDRTFILASDGIYEVGQDKTKVVEKTWSGDALIKAFAANIYVLDKAGGAIYRYSGGDGASFGSKQNWLAAGSRVDFSDAAQWVIDGAIYIRFPNSKIAKFNLGSPQNFTVSGVVPEIGKIDAIYTDADDKDVYLLDRAGKRIVVTDKKGKYIAQYLGDQIGSAVDLVVSEAGGKIILLTGDKLLSIDIKHL